MMDLYFGNVAKSEKQDGWTVLQEGRFALGASVGLETLSVRERLYRRRRVIVIGSWVYVITAGRGSEAELTEPDAERFLDSFQVTDGR